MEDFNELEMIDNTQHRQYEVRPEGHLVKLEYSNMNDGRLFMTNTEVARELRGKGYGKAMVERVLKHAEAEHLVIVPLCPFVKSFMRKNHQFQKQLATGIDLYTAV